MFRVRKLGLTAEGLVWASGRDHSLQRTNTCIIV